MRPICPECGREMIFVAVVLKGSGEFFRSWQCDCDYRDQEDAPREIVANIVRARENEDESLVYEWGTVVTDSND